MKNQFEDITEVERMAYEMERLFIEAEHKQPFPKKHPSIIKAEALYNAGYRKQSENTVEVVRCKNCEYWTEVSFDAITEWHWGECRKPLGEYRDCDTAEHDFCSYGKAKMKGGAE